RIPASSTVSRPNTADGLSLHPAELSTSHEAATGAQQSRANYERPSDEQAACSRPEINNLMGTGTERDDRLGLAGLEYVQELLPPVLDARRGGDRLGLAIHCPLRPYRKVRFLARLAATAHRAASRPHNPVAHTFMSKPQAT